MIKIVYNRLDPEETRKCFETVALRLGMNKTNTLALMNNPIANANADAWLVELRAKIIRDGGNAAVAAGKTTVSGNNVKFRDLNDTKVRVDADMTGNSRTDITIDAT